jgi:hypothetical protein
LECPGSGVRFFGFGRKSVCDLNRVDPGQFRKTEHLTPYREIKL